MGQTSLRVFFSIKSRIRVGHDFFRSVRVNVGIVAAARLLRGLAHHLVIASLTVVAFWRRHQCVLGAAVFASGFGRKRSMNHTFKAVS